MRTRVLSSLLVVAVSLLASSCDGDEATHVVVPLYVDGSLAKETTTAEGWHVVLDEARLGVKDLRFRRGGEEHASWLTPLSRWLLPSAHAHPGHTVGGEVVGEALGTFALDLLSTSDEPFAEATALLTSTEALDFAFFPLDAGEEPAASAFLQGTATRGDEVVRFDAFIVQDEGRRVDGIPLALDLRRTSEGSVVLGLRLTNDEGRTLFDGVDFGALPYPRGADVARFERGSMPHNRVRNALQSFEHYRAAAQERGAP